MRSNPLSPSAIPSLWHSHRQTPQEEFDMVTSMERQYRCDRYRTLQTNSLTFRSYNTQCTNPTIDKMNQKTLHHQQQQQQQQQHDQTPILQRLLTSLMEIDNDDDDLAAISQTQQGPRQSQIENHQYYNTNNSSSRDADSQSDMPNMLSGDITRLR